ncbi:MAG: LacI family DNA-binding transcriptional regulator [Fibrobacteres bacterium]|nr:LacI family DNA-binding transcriptional regulator [Fibrobacterota bacterium]
MPPPARPTRDDVAELAGVSTATVSRAYNNPESVAEHKRSVIFAVAKKLGYVPDEMASALRRGKTGIIALLEKSRIETASDRFLSTLYADVIRGLKSVIDQSKYRLSLITVKSIDDIKVLKSGKFCDAVIAHDLQDNEMLKAIRALKIPAVCAFREDNTILPQVRLDEEYGGKLAAECFLASGRTKPAHITGQLTTIKSCYHRHKGFVEAYGSPAIKTVDGELGINGGYESTLKLLSDIKNGHIDSIFVVNDITAVGVLQALQANGISVPRDVSIIAHDNLPILDTLPVRLTSIDISFRKIYSTAAKQIIGNMENGLAMETIVKPEIVKGDSV